MVLCTCGRQTYWGEKPGFDDEEKIKGVTVLEDIIDSGGLRSKALFLDSLVGIMVGVLGHFLSDDEESSRATYHGVSITLSPGVVSVSGSGRSGRSGTA